MYLSDLIKKSVTDSTGEKIGKLKDIIISPDSSDPNIKAITVDINNKKIINIPCININDLDKKITLKSTLKDISYYEIKNTDIKLAEDVLDHQVIDIEDKKVKRVNDIIISSIHGHYHAIGIDNGFYGILKRFRLAGIAKSFGINPDDNIIAWENIDTLNTDENVIDPVFHQILERRITPVWPMLHKVLGLPEILFSAQIRAELPSRTASQSSSHRAALGAEFRRPNISSKGSSPRSSLSGRSGGSGLRTSHNFLLAGSSTQSMSLTNIILEILRIFARHKFICLSLDDLDFADEESLELIAQIISGRIKIVMIVAYRPENVSSDTMSRILDPFRDEGTSPMRTALNLLTVLQ